MTAVLEILARSQVKDHFRVDLKVKQRKVKFRMYLPSECDTS